MGTKRSIVHSRQAVDSSPALQAAALHARLGAVHRQQGRLAAAVASYRQAIRLQPTVAALHFNLGNALWAQGEAAAAMASYREALRLSPDLVEAHINLGAVLQAQGQLDAARTHYEAALHYCPALVEAHINLALVLRQQGALAAARTHLETAVHLAPDAPEAHTHLGVVLQDQGDLVAARTQHELALRLRPDYPEALMNLAAVLRLQGEHAAAGRAYAAVLRQRPDCAAAHYHLGCVQQEQGQLAEAVSSYETAVALRPDHADAYHNLGVARQALGDTAGAVAAYHEALRLRPGCAQTHLSLALAWLAQGNLTAGWAAYEWRWHTSQEPRPPGIPRWDGSALDGKTILVMTEQGVGDELLFASCLPDLIARAGHVVWACDPRLAPLFARAWPEATVCGMAQYSSDWLQHLPPPDVYVPVGSLPRYLRPTLAHFPASAGYLRPDPSRLAQYQRRLATLGPGLKVGIAWRSLRTRAEPMHYPALDQWQPLFQVPGVHWVNLQYDEPEAELDAIYHQYGVTIHTWDDLDLLRDLDGVAALIVGLDLVIAPEMTVAALAGSLGQAVWRLTSAGGSWTSLGTAQCPWFPSVRVVQPILRRAHDAGDPGGANRCAQHPRQDGADREPCAAPGRSTRAEAWSATLAQLAHDLAEKAGHA